MCAPRGLRREYAPGPDLPDERFLEHNRSAMPSESPNRRKPFPVAKSQQILQALTASGALFRLDWTDLLRYALQDYCDENVFRASELAVRQTAALVVGKDENSLPKDMGKLAAEFCKSYLFLRELPRDLFIKEHEAAVSDLREIRRNITACETELAVLGARNNCNEGDSHRAEFLRYKVSQNEEVRAEIIRYLEDGIVEEICSRMIRGIEIPTVFIHRGPYKFRGRSHLYSRDSLSEVQNKFRERSVEEAEEWESLYHDDVEKFHDKLRRHIADTTIVSDVRIMLDVHHRLNARKNVLGGAIDAYEQGAFALFCSIIPIQVEGLIGDYCEEVGVPADDLRIAVLTKKLELIRARDEAFGDFEYFRYRFPVLRNKVAHGRLQDTESDRLANLLLLDLADICRRLMDEELPTNRFIALLRSIDPAVPECSHLLRFARMGNMKPPPFYADLVQRHQAVEAALQDHTFWNRLAQLVDTGDEIVRAGLKPIVIDLKLRGLDNGFARALLPKIGDVTQLLDEDDFWTAVESVS